LAIARNSVVDCQRRNGRHPMVALPTEVPDDALLPDTAVEAAGEQARLNAMIATLPEADCASSDQMGEKAGLVWVFRTFRAKAHQE
jgi:hypothetical protein